MNQVLLAVAYFPPIEFYHHLRLRYSLYLVIIWGEGRGSLILAFEEEFSVDRVRGGSGIGRTTRGIFLFQRIIKT